MSKFKIGDKVRAIKQIYDCYVANIGDVGVVTNVQNDSYYFPIELKINNEEDYGFKEDELELVRDLILTKNQKDIAKGIENIIERYLFVRDYINNNKAETKAQCIDMLDLIHEREVLSDILWKLGIQDFELKGDVVKVRIE